MWYVIEDRFIYGGRLAVDQADLIYQIDSNHKKSMA